MAQTRPILPFRDLSRRVAWSMVATNVVGLVFALLVMRSSGVVTAFPLLLLWQVAWGASQLVGERRPALAWRLFHLGWALARLGALALVVQGIVWLVRRAG